MIADLKPYHAMRDSSVPWLGEMPEHWGVLPNRAIFDEVKERDRPDAELLKPPAPVEEDLAKGLEAIDMDSYRVEKQAAVKILLPDADAEIEPVPTTGGGHKPEPELDRL